MNEKKQPHFGDWLVSGLRFITPVGVIAIVFFVFSIRNDIQNNCQYTAQLNQGIRTTLLEVSASRVDGNKKAVEKLLANFPEIHC